jgi:hypothetical protein
MGSGFLEFDGVLLVIVAERCKRWYYELRISGVFVKADIVETQACKYTMMLCTRWDLIMHPVPNYAPFSVFHVITCGRGCFFGLHVGYANFRTPLNYGSIHRGYMWATPEYKCLQT